VLVLSLAPLALAPEVGGSAVALSLPLLPVGSVVLVGKLAELVLTLEVWLSLAASVVVLAGSPQAVVSVSASAVDRPGKRFMLEGSLRSGGPSTEKSPLGMPVEGLVAGGRK